VRAANGGVAPPKEPAEKARRIETLFVHRLSSQYGAILPPVAIMAAGADKIVDSERQTEGVASRRAKQPFPAVSRRWLYGALCGDSRDRSRYRRSRKTNETYGGGLTLSLAGRVKIG